MVSSFKASSFFLVFCSPTHNIDGNYKSVGCTKLGQKIMRVRHKKNSKKLNFFGEISPIHSTYPPPPFIRLFSVPKKQGTRVFFRTGHYAFKKTFLTPTHPPPPKKGS